MKKSLKSRIWFGIKAGWELPVVPDHISKIDNNIYVKLFKYIGAISMFIIVSGIGSQLNRILFYIIFVINLFYIFYRLVFTFYVLKQWVYNLCTGKFLVRNSPLHHVSLILKGGVATMKSATTFTV